MTKLPSNISDKIFKLFSEPDCDLDQIANILGISKRIIFRNSEIYPEQILDPDLQFFDLENTTLIDFDFSRFSLYGANLRNAKFVNC